MKALGSICILSWAICIGPTAGGQSPDETKSDLEKLHGRWTVTKWMHNASERVLPKEDNELVIRGSSFALRVGGKLIDDGVITIDANAKPKTIDISHEGGSFQGKIGLGIYEVTKDGLTIAIAVAGAPNRPVDFSCKDGDNHVLLVLRRSSRK